VQPDELTSGYVAEHYRPLHSFFFFVQPRGIFADVATADNPSELLGLWPVHHIASTICHRTSISTRFLFFFFFRQGFTEPETQVQREHSITQSARRSD